MSIELLYDLQQEVRRLFIAGSGMAQGDMTLKKLHPQLQALGESAPVFKKIASGVQEVLVSDRENSAAQLLELGALLNAVLYTQGRTEAAGGLEPVEGTDRRAGTSVPYRKLHPVITALTSKGQGRLEALRQADEENLFHDFRVIPSAVAGLDDSYAEIADFLQRKVIPELGLEALPALRSQFRQEGGKGDARRLELLHRLLGEAGLELYARAAREGSLEVRAAAIEALGHYADQEDFLLEQADEKRKELRAAAYMALARLGTERAQDRLYRALDSKDRELAVEPVRQCESDALTVRVVRHAESVLERFLGGADAKEAIPQLVADLHALEGKSHQEAFELLRRLLSPEMGMRNSQDTDRLQETAVQLLLQMGRAEAEQFVIGLQHAYGGRFISYSLRAAVRTLTPEEVFERFAPELKDKKSAAAKDLIRTMEALIPSLVRQLSTDSGEAAAALNRWDPRWVARLVEADEEELVCCLAVSADKSVISYLVRKCKASPSFNKHRTVYLLAALLKLDYKEAPELLMEVLEQSGGRQLYYLDRLQTALLELLPAHYADRLQKVGESLSNGSVKKQVLDIAEELKSRQTQEASDPEKGTGLWGWLKNKML